MYEARNTLNIFQIFFWFHLYVEMFFDFICMEYFLFFANYYYIMFILRGKSLAIFTRNWAPNNS